ncbi:ubiquitin carrier protein 7 [Zea mays]|uniref:Ubiquitin carrier protein 7 n=1 Tax=Zea mays TaxID=4577 RepID=A0A1D6EQB0_MAIZE|nr:ubiquitin carrier protein 7 [Zea mays]
MWRGEVTAGAAEVEGEGEDEGTGKRAHRCGRSRECLVSWFYGFRCCWICRAGADGDDRRRAEAAGKGQRRPRPKDQFPVGMRVLAVDDDPTCLKVLENLLFRCQYHVTTMGQAATALSC